MAGLDDKDKFYAESLAKNWPFIVPIMDLPNGKNIQRWTEENCTENTLCLPYGGGIYLYCFKNEPDAVAFKIAWM